MKDFCVTYYEPCGGRFFRKGKLREENIYIHELDIMVTRFTLMCGKRIPPRLWKMLEAKTVGYLNVFPLCGELAELKRCADNTTIMTLMPLVSLRKCAGMSGVDLENEQVAVVLKGNAEKNTERIIQLCSGLSFARLYGQETEGLGEKIMEETGLCVSFGAGEPQEKFIITIGENITFGYIPHEREYKDLVLSTPVFLDKYKKSIPIEEIYEAFLKSDKGKEYIKTKKVKIIGAM